MGIERRHFRAGQIKCKHENGAVAGGRRQAAIAYLNRQLDSRGVLRLISQSRDWR